MGNKIKDFEKLKNIRKKKIYSKYYKGEVLYEEWRCPKCKRWFLGRRGLKQHLTPKVYEGCKKLK